MDTSMAAVSPVRDVRLKRYLLDGIGQIGALAEEQKVFFQASRAANRVVEIDNLLLLGQLDLALFELEERIGD